MASLHGAVSEALRADATGTPCFDAGDTAWVMISFVLVVTVCSSLRVVFLC
jgi:hypothetical protein